MRKALALLLIPTLGWSTIIVGNTGSGANIGGGTVTTGTGGASFSCASGNAVISLVADEGGSGGTMTASDSASNAGYVSYGSVNTGTQGREQWFVNPSIGTSITSASISFGSTTSFTTIHAYCISGLATSPIDFTQVYSHGGFNAAVVGGSFTTTNAAELVIMAVLTSGTPTITPSLGWTATPGLPTTIDGGADIYQVFSTIQTGQSGSGTLSGNNNWDTLTIGLKGASGGGGTTYNAPFFGNEL